MIFVDRLPSRCGKSGAFLFFRARAPLFCLALAALFAVPPALEADEGSSPLAAMDGVTSLHHDPENQNTVFLLLSEDPRRTAADVIEEMAYYLDLDSDSTWSEIGRRGEVFRYQQHYREVPVLGGQLVIREVDGTVQSVAGRIIGPLDVPIEEPVSVEAAIEGALDGADALGYGGIREEELLTLPRPELALLSTDGTYAPESFQLVYQFHLHLPSPAGGFEAAVDALTGTPVQLVPAARAVSASGTTLYSGVQTFDVSFDPSQPEPFSLKPDLYNLETRDRQGLDTPLWALDSVPVTSPSATFAGSSHPAAIGVHWATQSLLDYVAIQHNYIFSSPLPLQAFINCGGVQDRAFSLPMIYSTCYGNSTQNSKSYGTIDIVGHETAHHFIAATAAFNYSGESGALEESFSDIVGALLENHLTPPGDWLIGEDINPPEKDRNMADPKSDSLPTTYLGQNYYTGSDPQVGIYTNLAVQNYWFYLLTEGTQGQTLHIDGDATRPTFLVHGIGIAKAGRIAFANLLSLPSSATYPLSALNSTLQAGSIYGYFTPEHRATHDAWFGVGATTQTFRRHRLSRTRGRGSADGSGGDPLVDRSR